MACSIPGQPTRLTVNTAGKYLVVVSFEFDNVPTTTFIEMNVRLNGSLGGRLKSGQTSTAENRPKGWRSGPVVVSSWSPPEASRRGGCASCAGHT